MRISQGTGLRGRLTAVVLALLALAGCGGPGGPGGPEPPPFPRAAQRVICGSPAVAEIVFALGCGDRVAGVSEFTDWPPEAAAKPGIGSALAPGRERILRLAPDGILAQGRAEALARIARADGLGFLALPLDTLEDLRAAIAGFAAALGVAERGAAVLAELEAGFAALPAGGSVSVFVALGHAPGDLAGLLTAGPGTFLHELVELAGGRNVFADVPVLWPKISQEALIRRRPARILDFQPVAADETRRAALIADWVRLGFRADQVEILEEDYLLRPGPRAGQAAQRLARALGR
jgi:iron complex transport system substrate-binding protein